MSRSLITKWEDLTKPNHEGDRLSIFVHDELTGNSRFIDCYVSGIYREGDAEFDAEYENWSQLHAQPARER